IFGLRLWIQGDSAVYLRPMRGIAGVRRCVGCACLCLSLGWMPAAEKAAFRAESRLVLVPVSVTDHRNRPVLGLDRDNFRVFDCGEERHVVAVSREEAPLSAALLIDASRSMANKLQAVRRAVSELLRTANPEDEFSLIEFQDRARLTQAATTDTSLVRRELAELKAEG